MQLSLVPYYSCSFVDVNSEVKMSENDDCDRKVEKPTNTCHENVEQYLTDSSLHGLRYVGNRKISYFERYIVDWP